MKNVKIFLLGCSIVIIVSIIGLNIRHLIIQNSSVFKVEFHVTVDNIDHNTGETSYFLKLYHWHGKEIVRSRFYYGLTMKEIDSIKVIEYAIEKKYNNLTLIK